MIFNKSKYNSHWETRKLRELGEFRRGKSKHRPRNDKKLFQGGVYPFVQTGDVKAANLHIESHSICYNELGLKQSQIWPENTLCITIAANIAETAILKYPMCFPDSIVGFNADPDLSSEIFMHYVFTYIKRSIQNSASGSIQDNINIEYLSNLIFKIPQKPYQDRIANLLSTLDAKIALNQRINAELEALAQRLYQYWFVQFDFPYDFAAGRPDPQGQPYKSSGGEMVWSEALRREVPKGWGVGVAQDLLEFNPSLSLESGVEASYIDMGALPTDGYMTDFVQKKEFKGGTKLQNGDVLVARITPCLENGKTGLVTLLEENEVGFGSTEFIVIRGKKMSLSGFAACLARSERFRKYAVTNMRGTSGRKRVESKDLAIFSLPIPDERLLRKFEEVTSPFFKIATQNTIQSHHLSSLRDWLLPMLMNGQVQVGAAEEMVGEGWSMAAEPEGRYGAEEMPGE